MTRAVVVGSGPNGLAAAATLSAAGLDVHVVEAADELGGGARNSEPLLAGLIQDHCAAVHPMAAGSPYFADLDLPESPWVLPEIDCAHPLDDGDVVLLRRSIVETAAGLGRDGWRWQTLFGPSSRSFAALSEDILRPSSASLVTPCFSRGSAPLPRCPRCGPRVLSPRSEPVLCSWASRPTRSNASTSRSWAGSARASSPPDTPWGGPSSPAERERSPRPSSPGSVSVA